MYSLKYVTGIYVLRISTDMYFKSNRVGHNMAVLVFIQFVATAIGVCNGALHFTTSQYTSQTVQHWRAATIIKPHKVHTKLYEIQSHSSGAKYASKEKTAVLSHLRRQLQRMVELDE